MILFNVSVALWFRSALDLALATWPSSYSFISHLSTLSFDLFFQSQIFKVLYPVIGESLVVELLPPATEIGPQSLVCLILLRAFRLGQTPKTPSFEREAAVGHANGEIKATAN